VNEKILCFFRDSKVYIGSLNLIKDFNDGFDKKLIDVSFLYSSKQNTILFIKFCSFSD